MSKFPPTPEQQAVIDAARTGGNIVVTAAAGAGKTSTMVLLAEALPNKRIAYAAFNAKAAADARRKMPRNVQAKTSSAFARLHVIRAWGQDAWDSRMDAPRQNARDVANILNIREPHRISPERVLAQQQLGRFAMTAVTNFCFSADPQIDGRHVPKVNGVDTPEERRALVAAIVPLARKAWEEVTKPRGYLRFTFDHAMKMWSLSDQVLMPFDVLIVDEAQDTNPSWGSIVSRQQCEVDAVGDRYQQLYGWRGAVDALTALSANAQHRLTLTKSFRFGPAIAAEANKWLSLLGAEFQVEGYEKIDSRLAALDSPRAILTRTNAEAIATLMRYQAAGVSAGLQGGTDSVRKLAEAAQQLKETGRTWHPELCAFTSWGQVQDYCLAPDTRVLTTALNWRRIGSMTVGDELVGFDEEQAPGNSGRRFRTVTVENVERITRPAYRIVTDSGTDVVASAEHRWLVRSGTNLRWKATATMRIGDPIVSIGTWEQEDTRDAGWLAGLFDGEGFVGGGYETSRHRAVSLSQTEGDVMEQARILLKERGFDFGDYGREKDGVRQLYIKGGLGEQLRLLGTLRPGRLVAKAERLWQDRQVSGCKQERIVSIEYLGEREVVAVRTSGRTFIAEGLMSHNCDQSHDGGDLAVFVKLVDEYGTEAIIRAADRSTAPERAEVVISTAHKAKGGEWDTVRIATDFPAPKEGEAPAADDMMLAYVSVTRAKLALDREGLAWVDRFVGGGVAANLGQVHAPERLPEPVAPPVRLDEPADPDAPYHYRLLAADGSVLVDWTHRFNLVHAAQRNHPGSTTDSRATKPITVTA